MAPINILSAIKYIPRNAIYHVIRLALEGGSSYNRKAFIPKKRLRLTAVPRQIPVPIMVMLRTCSATVTVSHRYYPN